MSREEEPTDVPPAAIDNTKMNNYGKKETVNLYGIGWQETIVLSSIARFRSTASFTTRMDLLKLTQTPTHAL